MIIPPEGATIEQIAAHMWERHRAVIAIHDDVMTLPPMLPRYGVTFTRTVYYASIWGNETASSSYHTNIVHAVWEAAVRFESSHLSFDPAWIEEKP